MAEVLVFCDDCGHLRAVDMGTPEQKHKIFTAICEEILKKAKRLDAEERAEIKKLLEDRNYDELSEFLDDNDFISLNQRGGPSIVELETDWTGYMGLLEI